MLICILSIMEITCAGLPGYLWRTGLASFQLLRIRVGHCIFTCRVIFNKTFFNCQLNKPLACKFFCSTFVRALSVNIYYCLLNSNNIHHMDEVSSFNLIIKFKYCLQNLESSIMLIDLRCSSFIYSRYLYCISPRVVLM